MASLRPEISQEMKKKWILVMIEPLFQTIKVEIVLDELLIDFAEKVMIFEITKPLNPATFRVLRIVI